MKTVTMMADEMNVTPEHLTLRNRIALIVNRARHGELSALEAADEILDATRSEPRQDGGWRPMAEFEYQPGTPLPMAWLWTSAGPRVGCYHPPLSSRSPGFWASVPGGWHLRPTHFAFPAPPQGGGDA